MFPFHFESSSSGLSHIQNKETIQALIFSHYSKSWPYESITPLQAYLLGVLCCIVMFGTHLFVSHCILNIIQRPHGNNRNGKRRVSTHNQLLVNNYYDANNSFQHQHHQSILTRSKENSKRRKHFEAKNEETNRPSSLKQEDYSFNDHYRKKNQDNLFHRKSSKYFQSTQLKNCQDKTNYRECSLSRDEDELRMNTSHLATKELCELMNSYPFLVNSYDIFRNREQTKTKNCLKTALADDSRCKEKFEQDFSRDMNLLIDMLPSDNAGVKQHVERTTKFSFNSEVHKNTTRNNSNSHCTYCSDENKENTQSKAMAKPMSAIPLNVTHSPKYPLKYSEKYNVRSPRASSKISCYEGSDPKRIPLTAKNLPFSYGDGTENALKNQIRNPHRIIPISNDVLKGYCADEKKYSSRPIKDGCKSFDYGDRMPIQKYKSNQFVGVSGSRDNHPPMFLSNKIGGRQFLESHKKFQGQELHKNTESFINETDNDIITSTEKMLVSESDEPFLIDHSDAPLQVKTQQVKLTILISNGVCDYIQAANQKAAMHLLDDFHFSYQVVDGMDPSQREIREVFFKISGIRGNYPQIFASLDSSTHQYLGGNDWLQRLNFDDLSRVLQQSVT